MNFLSEYKKLPNSNDNVKKFFRENKLAKQGIYEKSEELFKPIIEPIKKQTELLENLNNDNQSKELQKIENRDKVEKVITNLGKRELPKTWLFELNKDKNVYTLNDKNVNLDENDNLYIEGSKHKHKATQGLIDLLNNADIDNFDVNNKQDVIDLKNYLSITDDAGSNKQANRYQQLINKITGRNGSGIVVIPNDKKQLWERLKILLAGKREGHNNSLEEITGILDQLLKMKEITIDDYKNFMSKNGRPSSE